MRRIHYRHGRILFCSDLHGDLQAVDRLIDLAVDVDAIVLAGDTPDHTVTNFKTILRRCQKNGVPIIVFPGSHENNEVYERTLAGFDDIINASRTRNVLLRYGEWDLICVGGSNVVASGPRLYKGGSYYLIEESPNSARQRRADERIRDIGFSKTITFISLDKIQRQLDRYTQKSGRHKVVFSHIPYLGETYRALDRAKFYVATEDFIVEEDIKERKDNMVHAGAVMPLEEGELYKKLGAPVELHKANVGDETLRDFLKTNRIKKFFCGHIHEAGRRAVDVKEHKVKKNTPSTDLRVNNGEHTATLITFHKNAKLSYEFLDLE